MNLQATSQATAESHDLHGPAPVSSQQTLENETVASGYDCARIEMFRNLGRLTGVGGLMVFGLAGATGSVLTVGVGVCTAVLTLTFLWIQTRLENELQKHTSPLHDLSAESNY